MSSVSLIRSNFNLNSKIIKKIDNVRILHNDCLRDVDVSIINTSNQEYMAHVIPKSEYDRKNIVYSNQDTTQPLEQDKNTNFVNTVSSKEYLDNPVSESDFFNISQNGNVKYNIQDIFLKVFNKDNIKWNILNSSNFSDKTTRESEKLQESFRKLIKTGVLEEKFLTNINDKMVFLNGKMIPSFDAVDIINEFQTSITDYKSQQLISTYLHPEILEVAWKNLSLRYPEVQDRKSYNIHYAYEIDNVGPGMYKLAVTKMADLQPSYSEKIDQVNQYALRASVIVTKDSNPKMKYSFFVQ
ncbi:hypothetical protein [Buchnera aphidicola]|uniref:hypothetical protein n=1 Tax=Buchnera aphidicola TaxID=9 RepID=UPI00107A7BA5|nr:hypothetical protein [Buchnera aphidicola]VFP79380.1 Uncharacterized protein Yba3 [Buchnera aphidicola (Cinara curtihirsuta)]